MTAFADYMIFGQRLKYYHVIGLVTITSCTVLISGQSYLDAKTAAVMPAAAVKNDSKLSPAWVPISFALMFPCMVTWNGLITKHITSEKIGFDPSRVTYFTFFIMNTLIMMVSIVIWVKKDNF